MAVEVVLKVRGEVDDAQIKALEDRLQGLGPVLQRVFDSGVAEKAAQTMTKVGDEAVTVATKVKAVTNSFDGSKLAADALKAAKGIEAIGGVSKLTEREMAMAQRTVDAALQKYKALGVEVPPGIAKLAAELKRAGESTDGADKSAKTWATGLKGVASSLDGLLSKLPGGDILGKPFSVGADMIGKMGGQVTGLISKIPGLSGLASSLGPASAILGPIAIGLGIVTAGVVGLTAASLKLGAESSAAYAIVAQKTGATGQALQGLETSMRHLAGTSTQSMGEVASGLAMVSARTGQTGPALEGLTKQLLQLSKVTGSDMSANVANTTRMFGDWGIATDKQSVALDKLYKASQLTGAGTDQLSQKIVAYGAPLRQLGFSYEQSLAMLGKWEKEGVNTELVLGSMKKAVGALAEANIPLDGGFVALRDKIKAAGSDMEAFGIAKAAVGIKGASDLSAAVREGRFDFMELQKGIEGGAGAIKNAASQSAGLGGQFKLMGNAAKAGLAPLTDAVFDIATKLLQQAVPAVQAFWSQIGDKLAPLALKAKDALIPLIEKIGPVLTSAVTGVLPHLRSVGTLFGTVLMMLMPVGAYIKDHLQPILITLAGVGIGALIAAAVIGGPILWGLATAAWALVAPALAAAAPFVLLGLAIGGAVALIVSNWETVGPWLTGVFENIKAAAGALIDYWTAIFTGDWTAALQSAKDFLTAIFGPDAAAALDSLISTVTGWRDSLVGLIEGAASGVETRVASLWNGLMGLFGSGVAGVLDLALGLWTGLVSVWENTRIAVSGIVAGLVGWLAGSFASAFAGLLALQVRLQNAFSRGWSWITVTVSRIAASLINWLSTNFGQAGRWLASILQRIMTSFSVAWTWIKNVVRSVVTGLVNGVVAAFHWLGSTATSIWQRMGSLFGVAWTWIISVFRRAVEAILPGAGNFFVKLVELAQRGMKGFAEIIGKAVTWVSEKLGSLFSLIGGALGAAGVENPLSGVMDSILSFGKNLGGSFAEGLGDVASSVRGVLGNVAGWFSSKIEDARSAISNLFSGGADKLAEAGKDAAEQAGNPDQGGGAGGGTDISGLTDSGGSAGKPDLEVGSTGHDQSGDWYIDENGKKIYTSGAGKARQDAQARAAAEKAAKSSNKASKEGAKKGLEDEASGAPALLKTMSDIAVRVAEATQAGLAALRELVKGDIPARAAWEPRLTALNEFVSVALGQMQQTGQTLFREVGQLAEGEKLVEGTTAQMIKTSSELFGGVLDTVGKASTFLQSLVKAKYPQPAQIGAALVLVGLLLTTVRDQSIALAEPFKDEEAGKRIQTAGQAIGVWSDAYIHMAESTGKLAAAVPVPPSAVATVESTMRSVAGVMRAMIAPADGSYNLMDDTEAAKEGLELASLLGDSLSDAVDLCLKVSTSAEQLARTPTVGERPMATVSQILKSARDAIAALIVDPDGAYNLLRDGDRTREDLGVISAFIDTMEKGVGLVSKVAAVARDLVRVPKIPPASMTTVTSILSSARDLLAGMLMGVGPDGRAYNLLANGDQTKEDLSVVQALGTTLGTGLDLVSRVVTIAKDSEKLKPLSDSVMTNTQAVVGSLVQLLQGLLVGTTPDGKAFNLLADDDATRADLGVVQTFIKTLSDGVVLVGQIAGLGNQLADAKVIDEGRMRGAIAAAELARQIVQEYALTLAASLEASGQYLEDVQTKTGIYSAIVRETLALFEVAKKVTTGDAQPIDAGALRTYLDNAVMVLSNILGYVDEFNASYERVFGSDAADVIARQRQQVTDWGLLVKEALGIFDLAKKLDTGPAADADPGTIRTILDNAVTVLLNVAAFADAYVSSYEDVFGDDALAKMAQTKTRIQIWGDLVKATISIVTEAAKLSIGDIAVVDAEDVRTLMDNAELVERFVREGVERYLIALGQPSEEALTELTTRVKLWGEQVKQTIGALKEVATFQPGDVQALAPDRLAILVANARMGVDAVRVEAEALVRDLVSQFGTLEAAQAATKTYTDLAKAAFELFKSGSDLALDDVRVLSPLQLSQLVANARLVLDAWTAAAATWTTDLLAAGRSAETVAAETKVFAEALKAASEGLSAVHKLILEITTVQEQAEGRLAKAKAPSAETVLGTLKDRIVFMMRMLGDAYREIETEAGTLANASTLAGVVAPAAEALAKVLDSLSLDRLLASPLVNMKLGSDFATGTRSRRLDQLAKQITEGVKRTVQALIDGLKDVDVPANLDSGLDRVAAAYERIVAILERVRDLATPDPAKIREIAAMTALLVAGLGDVAQTGSGVGLPGGGGTGGGGIGSLILQSRETLIADAKIGNLTVIMDVRIGDTQLADVVVKAFQKDRQGLRELTRLQDEERGGRP